MTPSSARTWTEGFTVGTAERNACMATPLRKSSVGRPPYCSRRIVPMNFRQYSALCGAANRSSAARPSKSARTVRESWSRSPCLRLRMPTEPALAHQRLRATSPPGNRPIRRCGTARRGFGTLSDNLPEAAIFRYGVHPAGQRWFEVISAGIERLAGIPPEEILRDPAVLFSALLPEDRERLSASMFPLDRSASFEAELRYRHRASGETRWALVRPCRAVAPMARLRGMACNSISLSARTPNRKCGCSPPQSRMREKA